MVIFKGHYKGHFWSWSWTSTSTSSLGTSTSTSTSSFPGSYWRDTARPFKGRVQARDTCPQAKGAGKIRVCLNEVILVPKAEGARDFLFCFVLPPDRRCLQDSFSCSSVAHTIAGRSHTVDLRRDFNLLLLSLEGGRRTAVYQVSYLLFSWHALGKG